MNENNYMNLALKEANKAFKNGDVPIGAIIVDENGVFFKSHNKKNNKNDATLHAEINVIKKMCKYKKTWNLSDCTIYVTMEPCLMCSGAMIQARIKKIYYSVENKKFGFIESIEKINTLNNNHKIEISKGILKEESIKLLKSFFSDKRNK